MSHHPRFTNREVWALAGVLAVVTTVIAGVGLMRSDVRPDRPERPEVRAVLTKCPGSDIGIITNDTAQLLTHDGHSFSPVLSPDAQWIVFERGDPETIGSQGWERHQLWVMRTNGSSARALTDMGAASFSPMVWSADSQTVMYPTDEDLMGIDISTGSSTVLLDDVADWNWGYWSGNSYAPSPDDTQLVTGGQLSIYDLSDGSRQLIGDDVFKWADDVTWSPDGEWLVMAAKSRVTNDPEGGLWAYRLDDGATWQISLGTSADKEWVGPDQLRNVRYGEGGTVTAYISDLSERQSTPVDAPESSPPFPNELDACAR